MVVSRQTINSIERGRYDPSLLLARFSGTSVEDLFDPSAEERGR
jgi:DNA-binding XRE family transcriptional regulator